MLVGVMATDGGPHSAEKWAVVTAGQLVQIATDDPQKMIEARKLENKIIEILEGHHDAVQKHERGKIAEHGVERLKHPINAHEHDLDTKVAEIVAAAKGSQWEAVFALPEKQAYIKQVLGSHFATSMDVERSWHADRIVADPSHAGHAVAKHYHKLRSEFGADDVHGHVHTFPQSAPAPKRGR